MEQVVPVEQIVALDAISVYGPVRVPAHTGVDPTGGGLAMDRDEQPGEDT